MSRRRRRAREESPESIITKTVALGAVVFVCLFKLFFR